MPSSDLHHPLLALAGGGNIKAQYLVGKRLYLGRGVQKNLVESLAWLYRAADAGHMKAAHLIVRIYMEEHHDPVELEKAAEAARRLEEITFPDRTNVVAEYSTKEQQDRFIAILFSQAQVLYEADDLEDAARLFLMAAKSGHKRAQFRVAEMYQRGEGFTVNADAALYWSETARSEKPLL